MKHITVSVVFLTVFFAGFAQMLSPAETQDESSVEQRPIQTYVYEPIRKGDQYIRMGLQMGIPLFNTSNNRFAIRPNIYPGGSICIGYGYYLTKGFSLGGDIAFSFYITRGSNLYFAIPFTLTAGYTFTYSKFRFPLSLGIGGNFQSLAGTKYFGLFISPRAGCYYQYAPEWSFGGDISWDIVPQWYKNREHNRIGNFLNIHLTARYHF